MTYQIGGIAIFIYGYYLLQQNQLSVGAFVSFLMYYFTAMHCLTVVVTNITEQKVLMFQVERLYRFIRLQPQVEEANMPEHLDKVIGEIVFHNVSFAYTAELPVLHNFNLAISPGERVGIVGKSGNGKSTTLKLIGRFYDADQGYISIDGIPIHELSLSSLRTSLGYVFQETYIFGSSVKDNIRFGKPDASDDEVVEAAKSAYAHEFISELPEGYDTLVGERGVKLSGGQKQRIAIARMLIYNPAIVLLDEATSALDNTSEAEVQKAFETLLKGRTVVAVAHRLSTIKQFDRIVFIEDGGIEEMGTYDELLERDGILKRLSTGVNDQLKEAANG
ncbi:ABC transporter ATP-binding protein [Paenibacillus eucommiae]|uniref:ABC-type multidrug transport system fused ATPase/permease subunit n=1 Tax=Paenibacillus eucommiae TaxID=1355755 RepID=A0ABS4IQY0_9BACL|nr:ATP-binding cassette domain-containing protein [Paenibacillus eucommiae]MBP1989401.1 ABC-type multidrug transport system fused ATPase/permease subunit [Paenibacillus eucommiae]